MINNPVNNNILAEMLLSLHIALIARWERAQTSYSSSEAALKFRINGALGISGHSDIGGYVAFFALAVLYALAIFLLFRLLSRVAFLKEALRLVAAPVALGVLPTCFLYVEYIFPVFRPASSPSLPWLVLELAGAIGCCILYVWRRWQIASWLSFLLLTIHFVFWTWLFLGGPYIWRAPFELFFPISGYVCSYLCLRMVSALNTSVPVLVSSP